VKTSAKVLERDESTSAKGVLPVHNGDMFQPLFERSADAMFLFGPAREAFVDCNRPAVFHLRFRPPG